MECGQQTILTSGALMEKKTWKPFKMWFLTMFEFSTRRTANSDKDSQRIMGFGSFKTAWSWLHKLGVGMLCSHSRRLDPFGQTDEALVGGKGGPHKQLVLVAAEANGKVRLAQATSYDESTLWRFADAQLAAEAQAVVDGQASYNSARLGERSRDTDLQTKVGQCEHNAPQSCQWTIPPLKRWRIGTDADAVKPKHLLVYLDESAFRYNRCKTNGVGRITARDREPRRKTVSGHAPPHRRYQAIQALSIGSSHVS